MEPILAKNFRNTRFNYKLSISANAASSWVDVMNEGNTCEYCKYALLIRGLLSNKVECRRYPPQLVMVGQESMGFGGYKWKPAWPQLSSDSFCGEFSFSSHAQITLNIDETDTQDSMSLPPRVDVEPSMQEYRGVKLTYMKITGKYMVEERIFSSKGEAMKYVDEMLE